MAARKQNDFLDIPASDDEASDRGYDSAEKGEESKGRSVKRRRTETQDFFGLESDDEDKGSGSDSEEETKGSRSTLKGKRGKQSTKRLESGSADEEDEDESDGGSDISTSKKPSSENRSKLAKPLPGKLGKLTKPTKKEKRGVVYFSTLPPYLKPFALKNILEQR